MTPEPPTIYTHITHGFDIKEVTKEEVEQFVIHEAMFMGELKPTEPTTPRVVAAWEGSSVAQGWRGARVSRRVMVLLMDYDAEQVQAVKPLGPTP